MTNENANATTLPNPNSPLSGLDDNRAFSLVDFRDPVVDPVDGRRKPYEFRVNHPHPLSDAPRELTVTVPLDVWAAASAAAMVELCEGYEIEVRFPGFEASPADGEPRATAMTAVIDSPEFRRSMPAEEFAELRSRKWSELLGL